MAGGHFLLINCSLMKKSFQQYTQLAFDFECSTVSDSEKVTYQESVSTTCYRCTKEEFEAQQAIERDYMFGRAAWLYQQLEREMAHERKAAKALAEFEAMRAEAYKYNF